MYTANAKEKHDMQNTNKTDSLYVELRKLIAAGSDGAPFPSVRQLIQTYGVSLSPVTAVLRQLKEEGFLTARPRKGYLIRKPDENAPALLLLQPHWIAREAAQIRDCYQQEAANRGFRFKHDFYDFRAESLPPLTRYTADILVIDGIPSDELTLEQLGMIAHSPVPVILSRAELPLRQINYVCNNNMQSGIAIAEYLHLRGHRKIGVLFCEPHLHSTDNLVAAFESRAEANHSELAMLDCRMQPGDRPDAAIADFIEARLAGKYDFTALFAISVYGAERAREELTRRGRRIPEDISVITNGFDCSLFTTFNTSARDYAEAVVSLARALLDKTPVPTRQIGLKPVLYENGSVRDLTANAAAPQPPSV